MKRVITAALVVLGATLLSAGSCQDSCAALASPTPAERSAASSGAEVERDAGNYDCELVDGRWVRERD
jgi:hypothetical protein